MDMGMGVVVPVRMAMGMAMSVVVMMGLGGGGNHLETLYYNIAPVHAGLRVYRSAWRWRPPRTEMAPTRRSGTRRTGPA
ncbi:hypothetical protein IQ17_04110 [Bradyrhizobium daqingense]|uniref:Uncharacterized protein n=1 Tax=Bradyrhizobium daqingense TaxID=993502 RepID=A0A562L497_9BRAD|nr:hypothetical protein IQ17_04110 [Bradyrhizobium daqingense]